MYNRGQAAENSTLHLRPLNTSASRKSIIGLTTPCGVHLYRVTGPSVARPATFQKVSVELISSAIEPACRHFLLFTSHPRCICRFPVFKCRFPVFWMGGRASCSIRSSIRAFVRWGHLHYVLSTSAANISGLTSSVSAKPTFGIVPSSYSSLHNYYSFRTVWRLRQSSERVVGHS